jgi:quercetin dioxygenase-like cupin family protein
MICPAHRHSESVTTYVLKGSIRSQLASGTPMIYETTGAWFEPPEILRVFAENVSATEPAERLPVFVADQHRGPWLFMRRNEPVTPRA